MTAEWVAVVVAIIAAGTGATVAVNSGFRRLADRLGAVEHQVAALAERVARLEGTLDVLRQYFAPRRDTDQTEGAA